MRSNLLVLTAGLITASLVSQIIFADECKTIVKEDFEKVSSHIVNGTTGQTTENFSGYQIKDSVLGTDVIRDKDMDVVPVANGEQIIDVIFSQASLDPETNKMHCNYNIKTNKQHGDKGYEVGTIITTAITTPFTPKAETAKKNWLFSQEGKWICLTFDQTYLTPSYCAW